MIRTSTQSLAARDREEDSTPVATSVVLGGTPYRNNLGSLWRIGGTSLTPSQVVRDYEVTDLRALSFSSDELSVADVARMIQEVRPGDGWRVQGRVMERGVDAYGLHLELDIPVSGLEGDRVVSTFLPSGLLDDDPDFEDS